MGAIGNYANKLANLEKNLNRRNDIARTIADEFSDELRKNLPALGDDYAHGAGNEVGYVSSSVSKQTATITWYGKQVWYLEFGTGSPAVGRYPDGEQMATAGGYSPRPNGHSLGVYWTLPMDEFSTSDGKPIVTKGWAPYAPFYSTQVAFRSGKFNMEIGATVRKLTDSLL